MVRYVWDVVVAKIASKTAFPCLFPSTMHKLFLLVDAAGGGGGGSPLSGSGAGGQKPPPLALLSTHSAAFPSALPNFGQSFFPSTLRPHFSNPSLEAGVAPPKCALLHTRKKGCVGYGAFDFNIALALDCRHSSHSLFALCPQVPPVPVLHCLPEENICSS